MQPLLKKFKQFHLVFFLLILLKNSCLKQLQYNHKTYQGISILQYFNHSNYCCVNAFFNICKEKYFIGYKCLVLQSFFGQDTSHVGNDILNLVGVQIQNKYLRDVQEWMMRLPHRALVLIQYFQQ